LFAILIWALLYATIFAPIVFRNVLARYMAKQPGSITPTKIFLGAGRARSASKMLPDMVQEAELESAAENRQVVAQLRSDLANKDHQIRQAAIDSSLRQAATSEQVNPATRRMDLEDIVEDSSDSEAALPGKPQAPQAAVDTGAQQQFASLMATNVAQESQESDLLGSEMPIGQIESLLAELCQEEAQRSVADDAQPFIVQAITLSRELMQARLCTEAERRQSSDAQRKISDLQAQLSAMSQQCEQLRQSEEDNHSAMS